MAKREKKRKARARGNGSGSVFKRAPNGPWYMTWYDHENRRRVRSSGTTDKRTAERILAQLVADVRLREEGVIDPTLDEMAEQGRKSIQSHLDNYRAKMEAAGRDAKHIRATINYIEAIANDRGWQTISNISADDVNHFLTAMKEKRRSNRTRQAYVTAVKGFTKWLTSNRKLPYDPLLSVSKPNPNTDRKLERRMLLPDEWEWLRKLTEAGNEREGMSGRERVLLYATAIQTGLRAAELRGLTRNRLHLAGDSPNIVCPASITKNAKDARQYIRRELAGALTEHVARKAPQAAVFAMPPERNLASMLRADLAAAREAWLEDASENRREHERRQKSDFLADTNHAGERLDFHALRHTCGSWLAMAGAHPKAIQAVMRHSTITLTLDRYGHMMPQLEAETVAKFPAMMSDGLPNLRATGTES